LANKPLGSKASEENFEEIEDERQQEFNCLSGISRCLCDLGHHLLGVANWCHSVSAILVFHAAVFSGRPNLGFVYAYNW
jgi:hypothetical protein